MLALLWHRAIVEKIMRIILSAVLLVTLAPALAAAQDPPAGQEPQILQPEPAPLPPQPTVVYYVPYFVPYVVFVPAAPPHAGKHQVVRQQPNVVPPPAVGFLAGPPVSATGVFAGNPATGMFAGAPATGVFVTPAKNR
jgi:hypothetical protein